MARDANWMKTILHVIETTGPGGAETVFIQLALRTGRPEFRSVAALPGPGWVRDQLTAGGCVPEIVPITRGGSRLFDAALYSGLVRLVRSNNVDLIHSHTLGISVYACLAGMRTRIPVVCTLHGEPDLGLKGRMRRIKFGLMALGAKKVVLVSASLRDRLLRTTRIPGSKTVVVHNGIDLEQFTARDASTLRSDLGFDDGAFLFGAVGNVRSAKAYDNLLRAAAIVTRGNPSVRFVIVGQAKGPLFESLRALSRELGVAGVVRFLGFRDDVPAVLRGLDAFVLSSRTEGFSLGTVQAMAAGLPVVATRSGGPEEIVTAERDGLLVPPDDPGALAEALLRVAHDADLRARIGPAARASAQARFSLQSMLDAYRDIYRGCVSHGSAR